jgi:hypothetical protein
LLRRRGPLGLRAAPRLVEIDELLATTVDAGSA